MQHSLDLGGQQVSMELLQWAFSLVSVVGWKRLFISIDHAIPLNAL